MEKQMLRGLPPLRGSADHLECHSIGITPAIDRSRLLSVDDTSRGQGTIAELAGIHDDDSIGAETCGRKRGDRMVIAHPDHAWHSRQPGQGRFSLIA
jgi:hypothetical protein